MNISVSGSGTSVVFIHGYCENHTIWHDFEKALSKHYQVILIDLPGHGNSSLPSTSFTIDEIADHVHDTLLEKGIQKYFVIGHSLGGYVSLALADLYPGSILGFGLFSSTTFPDDEEKKKARDKVGDFIAQHGVDKFIEPFVPNLIAPPNRSRLSKEIQQLTKIGKATPADTIIGYAQAMKNRPDRTHLFATANYPVFIIAGDRDMAVRIEASQQMIELIQTGDSLILQDTGHNGFVEAPNETLAFISGFLERYLK